MNNNVEILNLAYQKINNSDKRELKDIVAEIKEDLKLFDEPEAELPEILPTAIIGGVSLVFPDGTTEKKAIQANGEQKIITD